MEKLKTEVLVLGAGPGGYAAAFYAADKGKKVILVERDPQLGGVCLNRGCIPSKALLNATKVFSETKLSEGRGISFSPPSINLDQMRDWKDGIIKKLSGGIAQLAKQRGVQVVKGRGSFDSSNSLRVETPEGNQFIEFEKAIVAVGSRSSLPKPWDLGNPRVMTSKGALEIQDIPKKLLVIGGGYIGMELGTVYARLGSEVIVAEALENLLSGADADLVRPVAAYAKKAFKEVRLKAKVQSLATSGKQIKVTMQFQDEKLEELYDRVLVAVGRRPNTEDIGQENTKLNLDDKGFIKVNDKQQTDDPSIFAIGDVVGGVMLAHKASKEARVAVEVICGENSLFEKEIIIPAVVFTDPEVAWCGLTENEAKDQDKKIEVAKFPWGASGRALTMDRTDGLTKLIIDPETERILGVGLVGVGAGELISEGVLAIEMGATVEDLASVVHPHPTLSETMMECGEAFFGHATHTYRKK